MFKERFKYYKSKEPPPNLHDVFDFNLPFNSKEVKLLDITPSGKQFYGLKATGEWEFYEMKTHPGFLLLRNPFTPSGQRYWITRSLVSYPRKPNKTNLDVHNLVPDSEHWWEYTLKKEAPEKLREKLRWVTFGYHHNWNTKIYSEISYSAFPKDLKGLCKYIANALGFPKFESQAAIVNYYHLDSTLSGHTDHSEENLEAPLFSFSFGQNAIFLLGGTKIEDDATAMFLQSGDIAIMTQESRLSYHGVPKILKTDHDFWNDWSETTESIPLPQDFHQNDYLADPQSWQPISDYLKSSRININVRQVLKEGQTSLSFTDS